MEVRDPPDPFGARGEESGAEMQGALFLAEAGAGNEADARGVQEAEAVEFVGLALLALGLGDGFGGEVDRGEEVHGTLRGGSVTWQHAMVETLFFWVCGFAEGKDL